ncbi:Uncharacterised protein [Klebsiella pneumoniae]|nr:Uncharacterised protein [Klebsiella pneumoniae]
MLTEEALKCIGKLYTGEAKIDKCRLSNALLNVINKLNHS